jgi:glutamate---cysteine ligase / carboxylate-amine ligase
MSRPAPPLAHDDTGKADVAAAIDGHSRDATATAVTAFDEGALDGGPAAAHDRVMRESLRALDLGELSAAVAGEAARRGVCFSGADGELEFRIDPIPRLFDAELWHALSTGIAQRARALELFVRDVYGPQAIVRAGIVPERALDGA